MHTRGSPMNQDLIYSFEVLKIINPTEYAALGDAAKDGLRIILSCGLLDLSGVIRTNLLAIFASSPITKAALESL
jgi:hypothetical protein